MYPVYFCIFLVFLREFSGIHAEAYHPRERLFRNHELARAWRESTEHSSDEAKSHGAHFGYHDTEEWGNSFPICSGTRQSPIDLNSYEMARLEVPSPMKWQNYRNMPANMTLKNNGHTVELSGAWEANETPYITGGPLDGDYAFAQLHFHWASRDDLGSEHTINNRSLPLEMHMVHFKRDYGSLSEAMKHEDGLAVIGILFEINNIRNPGLSLMQKFTSDIKLPNSRVSIKPFPLSQFNLEFPDEYVSYLGSLTTPPCSEIVMWILPAIPRFLSEEQIDLFRSVQFAGGDDHNFRQTKPRNGRMIYYISH